MTTGGFDLKFCLLRNIINAISFGDSNLQYAKSFHPNIMKFTAFTKLNLRVPYMNFLSNQSISPICYNSILK